LLLNAIQALDGKGHLEISLRKKIDKGETFAHIVVKDDGPGLPEASGKIFEPFFTTKTKGSGLGLAVCKQLVEKHGGRIIAESEKGKGTTMHVWLPAG
jgi:signal transduction histidine kinase